MQKICKCTIVNGIPTPEPGFAITGTITIRIPDGDGQLWYMTKRTPAEEDPSISFVEPPEQFGTTAKRPTGRMSKDWKGFCYFDTTLDRPIWWAGTKWKFSDGTNA
jgi:hypothetical protein